MGTAHDARVEFQGVTILRLPVISFPVGDARKSGFLFPDARQHLARWRAACRTLLLEHRAQPGPDGYAHRYYSKRGVDLGGRIPLPDAIQRGTAGTPTCCRRTTSTATTAAASGCWIAPSCRGDWRLSVDAENVSDAQYFEDFLQGPDGTSIAFLPRLLHLRYRRTQLGCRRAAAQLPDHRRRSGAIDRPYSEVPRVYAQGTWSGLAGLPLEYGFDTEASGLPAQRRRRKAGACMPLPRAALNIEGAGYFLRPALAYDITQYRLNDVAPGQDDVARAHGCPLPASTAACCSSAASAAAASVASRSSRD